MIAIFVYCSSCALIFDGQSLAGSTDKTITEIDISKNTTVTSISNNAFENFLKLEIVSIPNTIKSLGNGCFLNCKLLKFINIPNSVENIGAYSFCNCSNLRIEVRFPRTCFNIQSEAFFHTSITSILFEEEIKLAKLSSRAFASCHSINKEIKIPVSVQYISEEAFSNCNAPNIFLHEKIIQISRKAFYGTNISGISLLNHDTIVDSEAFAKSYFKDSINSIKFQIESVIFRDSFFNGNCEIESETIGDFAFKSVFFSGSLLINNTETIVSSNAFCGAEVNGTANIYLRTAKSESFFEFCVNNDLNLHLLGECKSRAFMKSRIKNLSIDSDVGSEIPEFFFESAQINTLSIGGSVGTIFESAFENAEISEIFVDIGNHTIYSRAFADNRKLLTLYIKCGNLMSSVFAGSIGPAHATLDIAVAGRAVFGETNIGTLIIANKFVIEERSFTNISPQKVVYNSSEKFDTPKEAFANKPQLSFPLGYPHARFLGYSVGSGKTGFIIVVASGCGAFVIIAVIATVAVCVRRRKQRAEEEMKQQILEVTE